MFKQMTDDQRLVVDSVLEAQAAGDRHFVLWYGSVRAGKTVGSVMAMLAHTVNNPTPGQYIIGVHTVRQGINIIGPYVRQYAAELGIKTKINRSTSNPHIRIGESEWLFFSGGEQGRDAAVQGITADGLFLDELALLDKNFVAQAEARVSKPGGLRIYTSNKTTPWHWTTEYYYKRAQEGTINAQLIDTNIDGNQFLAADYVAERMLEYDEDHMTRFMNNEFMLDFEPVYNPVEDNNFYESDFAIINTDGRDTTVVHCAYTDYGICITDVTEDLLELPSDVFINSGWPHLIKDLRKRQCMVRDYRSMSSSAHIDTLSHLFDSKTLRLNRKCKKLAKAFDNYYDPSRGGFDIITALEATSQHVMRRIGKKYAA